MCSLELKNLDKQSNNLIVSNILKQDSEINLLCKCYRNKFFSENDTNYWHLI